jgi:hypothetical protein
MLVTHSNAAIEATAALQAKIILDKGNDSAPAVPKPKPRIAKPSVSSTVTTELKQKGKKGKGKVMNRLLHQDSSQLESFFAPVEVASLSDEDLGFGESETGEVVDTQDFVDISLNSSVSAVGGRPKKKILDEILQCCYRKPKREKILYCCLGSCGMVFSNRNTARAVCHAVNCHCLPADVHKRVKSYAAAKAPSHGLKDEKPEGNGEKAENT